MNKFKNIIQKRMIFCCIIAIIAVAISVFDVFYGFEKIIPMEVYPEVGGFQTGLLMGLGLVAFIWFVRYAKCIRDDDKLRVLYNSENDERKKLIKSKAGMPMLMITSGCIIFAGIIAGYFSRTIFFTLIFAASSQMLLGVAVKIYYLKNL